METFLAMARAIPLGTITILLCASASNASDLTIVAFGDSIIASRGKLVVHADILRKELPKNGVTAQVINAGIGGNTTEDGRARFAREVLQHKPDIVIILFGGNDSRVEVFRDPPATEPLVALPRYRENLAYFVNTLRNKGTKVILMTSPQMRWSSVTKKLYNKPPYRPGDPNGMDVMSVKYAEAMRDVAQQQNVPLVDVRAAFEAYARQESRSIDGLYLDGLHPNTQGQRMIADLLIPEIIAVTASKTNPPAEASNRSNQTVTEPLQFEIKLETILKQSEKWIWFIPRVVAIPKAEGSESPAAIMTLQKHLQVSDHFGGLHMMRSDDLGASWAGPEAPDELAWRKESDEVTVGVKDVTPGWHAPSGKLLAIGVKVRYNRAGHILYDKPRSHEAAYGVYDPKENIWTPWRMVEMPMDDSRIYLIAPGNTQWLVEPNGTLLIPAHFWDVLNKGRYKTTVLRCAFDGTTLKYLDHGDELTIEEGRGLYESSLARFHGKYYLTLRSDDGAHVTVSEDGLHYQPIKPWTFDDSSDLGSHNTQQHWLVHSDGLLLVYTRRGADNDHIARHRAPLFVAQVDPDKLCVIRSTERVLVPEHGATLGNFGAAKINRNESWVTVAEGIWGGAESRVFLARVIWSKPNNDLHDR